MHRLLLVLVACLTVSAVGAAPVISGDYDGLLIGVDRHGTLTGYFESSTGNGQFSCIFFMRGKVSDPTMYIDTWFPEDRDPKEVIPGKIESLIEKGKVLIRTTLKEEHGGCWNVQRFASEPVSFSLTEQGSWESIRVVSAKKAIFFNDPSNVHPRRAYVVKGNALRVFETQAGWVRAEYVSGDRKRTQGWISERDLYRSDSPATK
jgi:hypothetical protein